MAEKITNLEEIVRIMDTCKGKIKITINECTRLYNVLSASAKEEISPFWKIKNYKREITRVFADEIDSIEMVS